ncbi:MBL fold metallo-hydrolase [Paenarthrobacter sp. A20]|uniref:MBL fold metallo-hydrolase n=1 Tax=Paenarthrobacter sp. A20 TaxID=2817891 RepID=UPI0020A0D561|nr:MBL fold metallo-hydrolase [Paenarthrobacter sp. A20]MCP1415112.1 glyoxylase-like metal-dependent hydrolase (beta-lactamase superfamily II)/rhodanese-related sulfurtransferase [Paenarthrobacter sp. A20]
MDVVVIETPQLGDRSYLVHDGTVAVVIDPQRDIDRVEKAAREAGVRITHVAETHLHNDYVTGGLVLAEKHGAAYLVNAADEVSFVRVPVTDGQVLHVGRLRVSVVATPGHTHTHLSYVVRDDTHDGGPEAVFSGGSLLYGSVGRTDLVSPHDTAKLAHDQYSSVRRLVDSAHPDAALYPTHGFGSFCSIGPASHQESSTIGEQAESNHALTDSNEDHFVAQLLENITAYPAYYAHMSPLNAAGVGPADLDVPDSVDPEELDRRLTAGEWVVDLRHRVAFADSHLHGSVSFEYGKGDNFTSYLGWVIPWNQPLTLLGPHGEVHKAIRDLARIGIDNPDAAVGPQPGEWAPESPRASYPHGDWTALLKGREPEDMVLDVRRPGEFKTSHIKGALNVPVYELLARISELPDDRIWVHCATGYRASVAASLLDRAGRDVVLINARFKDAAGAGIETT